MRFSLVTVFTAVAAVQALTTPANMARQTAGLSQCQLLPSDPTSFFCCPQVLENVPLLDNLCSTIATSEGLNTDCDTTTSQAMCCVNVDVCNPALLGTIGGVCLSGNLLCLNI